MRTNVLEDQGNLNNVYCYDDDNLIKVIVLILLYNFCMIERDLFLLIDITTCNKC